MLTAINCGSGQRPFATVPGEIRWVNIDKVAHEGMPAPDIICDGAHLPFINNEVDYFVLNHVYEHAGLGEADGMIKEAYRILKPGASLIVTIPDLRALAVSWLSGKLDTITYVITLYGAYMGHDEDRHKFGYDRKLLTECLSKVAAWSEVKPFDWRPIPGASIPKDYWILGCECVK
jgi:predicted SAM-dependent methyltransferase